MALIEIQFVLLIRSPAVGLRSQVPSSAEYTIYGVLEVIL